MPVIGTIGRPARDHRMHACMVCVVRALSIDRTATATATGNTTFGSAKISGRRGTAGPDAAGWGCVRPAGQVTRARAHEVPLAFWLLPFGVDRGRLVVVVVVVVVCRRTFAIETYSAAACLHAGRPRRPRSPSEVPRRFFPPRPRPFRARTFSVFLGDVRCREPVR